MRIKNKQQIMHSVMLLIVLNCCICFANAQISKVKAYTADAIQIMTEEYDVVSLFAIENYLIISKEQRYLEPGEFLFRLFKLPNMEFICEFGRVGRGPDEFEQQTRHNRMAKVFADSMQLWLYELNKSNLKHVTLNFSNRQNPFVKVNKRIDIPFELNLSTPVYVGNNIVAGKVLSFDLDLSRLRFYDLENKRQIDCPLLPHLKNRKPSDIVYIQQVFNPAYTSFVEYSNDNGVFVSSMTCIDRIDLYNEEGKHLKAIFDPLDNFKAKYPEDILSSKYENGSKKHIGNWYYYSPIVYKKFFSVLFLGVKFDLALSKASLPCQMRFYNYEGELKAVLKINENIDKYTIDEKNGVLYASCRFDGNNYKYDIKDILDEL